jgi:hypothetical protein
MPVTEKLSIPGTVLASKRAGTVPCLRETFACQ